MSNKNKKNGEEAVEQSRDADALEQEEEEARHLEEEIEAAEEDAREAAEAGGGQEEAQSESEPSVASLQEQLESQRDRFVRLMAEFDNFKRRTSREYERLIASANERLMLEIIEVRENFQRALDAGEQNTDYEKFYEGMRLIFNRLDEILGKNGLSVFADPGDEFNPEIHDAMMKMPHESIPEDHISQIYEKGYSLGDRVIKHAKVIVSSGADSADSRSQTHDGDHDDNDTQQES